MQSRKIVLFGKTGDGKSSAGNTIISKQEFITDASSNSVTAECESGDGGRCHSRDWNDCDSGYKSNRVQVKNLLDTIDTMEKENGCFSNELLKKLEEIQKEMEKNKDNLPPEEKREKANEIVHKSVWFQVAGATTGTLIGAVLGVGVAVTAVLSVINPVLNSPAVKSAVKSAVKVVRATAEGASAVGGAGAVGASAVGAAAAGAAVVKAVAAAGGGGAAAVETGAAAGAVVGVKAFAAGVVGVATVAGAVGGGVTGWKAAEEADSVYDAMTKAAKLNYENATVVSEKIQEFVKSFGK